MLVGERFKDSMEERLQKLLSRWGVASRRHAETLIQAGRVKVNGTVAQLGQRANPNIDCIELDDRELLLRDQPEPHYFLLHKPLGVLSTCQDPRGRKTVLAFLPKQVRSQTGIHPVGRLDYNSTGALLLTNDGDLTYQLTHPRHHIPKVYRVVVAGKPSAEALQHWRQGVYLAGRRTLPATVTVVADKDTKSTELEIVLREGRNRQIRRVAESLGYPVKRLHRIAIGPIHLNGLTVGQVRRLSKIELTHLRQAINEKIVSK